MIAKIAKACSGHGPAISAILSDWIDETEWMPNVHSLEDMQGYGAWLIEVSDVTVALVEDKVVGFMSLQNSDIQALYLSPEYREFGIGRKLLDSAKSQATDLGLWTFQANIKARRFYLSNSFIEDKRSDGSGNDEKLPDVHFVWMRDSK